MLLIVIKMQECRRLFCSDLKHRQVCNLKFGRLVKRLMILYNEKFIAASFTNICIMFSLMTKRLLNERHYVVPSSQFKLIKMPLLIILTPLPLPSPLQPEHRFIKTENRILLWAVYCCSILDSRGGSLWGLSNMLQNWAIRSLQN